MLTENFIGLSQLYLFVNPFQLRRIGVAEARSEYIAVKWIEN